MSTTNIATPSRRRAPRLCRKCPGAPLQAECVHGGRKNKVTIQKPQTRSVTGATPNKPKTSKEVSNKPRGPRHCRSCPGNPLRSECEHTAKGRTHIVNQAVRSEIQEDLASHDRLSSFEAHPPNFRPVENGTFSPNEILAIIRPTTRPTSDESFTTPSRGLDVDPLPSIDPILLNELPPPPPHQLGNLPSENSENDEYFFAGPGHAREQPNSFSAVDAGLEDSEFGADFSPYSPPPSPSAPISSRARLNRTGRDTLFRLQRQNDPYPSGSSPASSQQSQSHRATKHNPIHGYVKGAMRGSTNHSAIRKHALPKPVEQTSVASKRFLEMINSLLAKCEDISVSTLCWLFIGAQHIAAKAPTIHYTSPRLLNEAPEFAEQQINAFNDQMTLLLRARRSDAVTVTAELLAAEDKNKRLERELLQIKERLRDADKMKERYDRILAEMR